MKIIFLLYTIYHDFILFQQKTIQHWTRREEATLANIMAEGKTTKEAAEEMDALPTALVITADATTTAAAAGGGGPGLGGALLHSMLCCAVLCSSLP